MSSTNSSSAVLLSAVKEGDYAKTQKLLDEHGLSIDDKWNDYKILIHAVHAGYIDIVELLLSHGCRVRSSKSNSCKTPLCYAVNSQDLEMVKILLEAGASITDKDSNVDTPLYMAAKNKFFTAVDLMLSKYNFDNIDVTSTDEIIHFYIVCIRNNVDLFRLFLKHGMNVNTYVNFDAKLWPGYSPLHFAVEHESVEVMELLLIYRANYTFLNAKKMSPLHLAYYLESSKKNYMITSILSIMQFRVYDANPVDNKGLSHFHIACTSRYKETVENFVKSGVIINSPTSGGCYPLHFAVAFGHKDIVEILLKYGANVNVKFENSTPLHIAIKKKYPAIAKLLLMYGANVCAKDQNDCSPIHTAYYNLLSSYGIFNSMMSLHQGKMMNITDKYGLSIFHIACAVGNTNAVENFLQKNVDVNSCLGANAEEFSGFTGLHFAAMNFHEDVIKLLLKHHVNVNVVDKNGQLAIWIAAQFMISESMVCQLNDNILKGKLSYKEAGVSEEEVMNYMSKEVRKTPIIKLLVENKSNLYHTYENGTLLLFKAYNPTVLWKIKDSVPNKKFIQVICKKYNSYCRREILEILLKTGVGFYPLDKHHNSILHLFAQDPESNENLQLVNIIMTSGCNLNVINNLGKTALHVAADKGSIEYVKILLKYEANANCTDKNLSTPLHCVAGKDSVDDHNVENAHVKILRLLIDKGANVDARNKIGCTPLFAAVQRRETMRALLCLLKADCQVNVVNKKEMTPLLLAARKKNCYAVKLLLDYGADINLTCKNQCSLLKRFVNGFKAFDFFDLAFMETFKVLEMHIEKMRLINYPVSSTDLIYRKYLGIMLTNRVFTNIMEIVAEKEESVFIDSSNYDLPAEDNFITPHLRKELEKMKKTKIDGYTSLHDILFKNEIQMVKHVKNEIFNEFLEEDTLYEEFQHYGFLLRLKHKEGMNRYVLLESAKESFDQVIGQNLPDLCLDGIFVYLSNADLKSLAECPRLKRFYFFY